MPQHTILKNRQIIGLSYFFQKALSKLLFAFANIGGKKLKIFTDEGYTRTQKIYYPVPNRSLLKEARHAV